MPLARAADRARGPACAAAVFVLVAVAACDEAPPLLPNEVTVPVVAAAAPGVPLLVYEQGKGDARDLFVVAPEGGVPRRLTVDAAKDGLPRWSRDGRSVVFTSNRSGSWQIWRIPARGGDPVRVRSNAHREWQADESPDLRRLAFLSNAGGAEWLWIQDLGSGEAHPLVRHGRRTIMGNPHFSPDGKRIVFSSNWKQGHQIYVVDLATGQAERISTVGGCEPRFSPDGRKVVYVGRRPRKDRSEILEHDLETGEESVLVAWPALNYDPAYSPDGEEIAFASTITGGWEIYRQRLDDGRSFRVTSAGEDARYPDYRPVREGR